MINFQRLRYFCEMVDAGGIHKAARRLGLSQPPLSLALRELEKEVGCQLVFRSGRNWIVTEAGQRLYEEGRAILAQAESLPAHIIQTSREIQGEARAGFSTSCAFYFKDVLAKVFSLYPDVSCHVMFTDSGRLAAETRQRTVDFAVLYLPVEGNDFTIQPLRPQRLVAIYSRLLPQPPEGERSLEEICQYPLVLPRRWKGGGIYSIFAEAVQRLKIKPRIVCQTQSTYLLPDFLENLPAIAILPEPRPLGKDFPEERYIRELPQPLTPAIITLKNTFLPIAAHRVISLIQDSFGQADG